MSNQQLPPQQGTVLIVDDNPTNLRLLSQALAEKGYGVQVANSGAQAIESAQSSPPDLILLNTNLTEMEGDGIRNHLKASEQLQNIPIIFISDLGSEKDKINDFTVDDVEYIVKLLQTKEVLNRVEMHLTLRDARKQLEEKNRQLEEEILARKKMDDALRKSEERFRSLVEATSDWIWEVDSNGVYTYVSPKIRDLLGYEPHELIGKTPLELMPPEVTEQVAATIEEILASRKPFKNLENVNLHRDGSRIILETSGVPIFNHEGIFLGYRGIDRDVTERVQAERALWDSEKRYRDIFTRVEDVIYETDFQGNLIGISPSIEKQSGYPPHEVIGKNLLEFYPNPDEYTALWAAMETTGAVNDFEIHLKKKNGDIVVTSVTAHVVFDEEGQPIKTEGVLRNIAERKQAERELQESIRRFRAIFDQTFQFTGLMALDGTIIEANEASLQFVGLDASDVIGKPFWETVWLAHSTELQEQMREAISKAATGEFVRFEVSHPAQDGSLHYFDFSIKPVKDEEGNVILLIPEGRDINERKQAENEVRKLNEELEQRVQERTTELETTTREMDTFQYTASHDLRTPLRGIDGYAQVLLEDYAEMLDDEGKNYLQSIRRGAQRMGEIIDDMLRMSRITQHQMYITKIDMTSIVQCFAREFREEEPQREMEFIIAEGIHAKGDEYLISIALENLLGNAVKFTRHQKTTRISFGILETDGKRVFFVQDNGVGFNMEYKGKLYTAFQRLHRQDTFEGSGVGLAIVNRIIARHKGEIWAEAEEGEGATFYFTIGL